MSHGFVYMLRNIHMVDIVKIGCTERSPHLRAEEISKGTGIPAPFDVVCYIEVTDHQAVERRMHRWLEKFRVSPNREFFEHEDRDFLVGLFYHQGRHNEGVLAFTDVTVEDFLGWSVRMTNDPWQKAEETPPAQATELTVVEGGKEATA